MRMGLSELDEPQIWEGHCRPASLGQVALHVTPLALYVTAVEAVAWRWPSDAMA
jgi:hypothetical protein